MELDKFGRTFIYAKRKHRVYDEHVEFNENEMDIKKRRIINVAAPTKDNDAVNKKYIDTVISDLKNKYEGTVTNFNKETTNLINEIVTEKIKGQKEELKRLLDMHKTDDNPRSEAIEHHLTEGKDVKHHTDLLKLLEIWLQ